MGSVVSPKVEVVVGRDAELDLIDGARRRGVSAVVIGVVGVGKTRLVRSAVERARPDGLGCRAGSRDGLGVGDSFGGLCWPMEHVGT